MEMVWLTRTEPGASRQAAQLRERGFNPLVWPVLDIVELDPPGLVQNGQRIDHHDSIEKIVQSSPQLVIALSGHAVRGALSQDLLASAATAKFIAVGDQTASLLGDVASAVVTPTPPTSEGILALPEIAEVNAGNVVWVLAGQGGRELIAQHLFRECGATVVKFELYRRQERTTAPEHPARAIGAVVIGSQQGLAVFGRLWQQMLGARSVPLVVPSSRVAEAARQAGFTEVHTADGADTQAVLEALQDIGT